MVPRQPSPAHFPSLHESLSAQRLRHGTQSCGGDHTGLWQRQDVPCTGLRSQTASWWENIPWVCPGKQLLKHLSCTDSFMHCRYAGYPVCEDTRFFLYLCFWMFSHYVYEATKKKLSMSEQGFIHTLDGAFLGITSLFLYLKISIYLSYFLFTMS